jgi:pyrroline-5-carboxylate reductase
MKFGKKLSINAFKEMHNAEKIQIIRNPKTDKLFVSANGQTVASVSKNYDATNADKEFVELIMEDTGETIWCLHNSSNANVEETL